MPMPRGLALGSVSGMSGRPVELEKRIVRGVVDWLRWGAVERVAASLEGWKVPVRRRPLPWAGRMPACLPKMVWSWDTSSWLVLSIGGSDGRGILQVVIFKEQ